MPRKAPEPTYQNSRAKILNYVLSHCVSTKMPPTPQQIAEYETRCWASGERAMPGTSSFCYETAEYRAKPGDLILLTAVMGAYCPLGWLLETKPGGWGGLNYLIRNVDTGQLMWWDNVGVKIFPRHELPEEWRWDDRQHAFAAKWNRVCYKRCGAYISRPVPPVFSADPAQPYAVTLGTRTTHGFDNIAPRRTYQDWRRLTIPLLMECYYGCDQEREAERTRRAAAGLDAATGTPKAPEAPATTTEIIAMPGMSIAVTREAPAP